MKRQSYILKTRQIMVAFQSFIQFILKYMPGTSIGIGDKMPGKKDKAYG